MPNMSIRVIDAYVYRTTKNGILFLILKRAKTKMYEHIWQGVAGKIEKDEKSWETAKRELLEETGYKTLSIPKKLMEYQKKYFDNELFEADIRSLNWIETQNDDVKIKKIISSDE